VKVIDLAQGSQLTSAAMPNPEPADIVAGRPMLYDANRTSANGESSCSSCHTFGDKDELAWDLGDPNGAVAKSPIPQNLIGPFNLKQFGLTNINGTGVYDDFHPMKGPMTTQTLAGMTHSGAMHWRGDRSNGFFGIDGYTGSDDDAAKRAAYGDNEVLNFKNFIVALGGLLGKATPPTGPTAEDVDIMDKFAAFQLQVQLPPNPIRALDNKLNASQERGRVIFMGPKNFDGSTRPFDGLPGLQPLRDLQGGGKTSFTCNDCHRIDAANGRFGTQGESNFEGETQILKVPQLRNMYSKVGMFGTKDITTIRIAGAPHQGAQVRGFGFIHDGMIDTLFRFLNLFQFNDPLVQFEKMHKGKPTELEAFFYMSSSFGRMGFPYFDWQAAPMQRDVEQFLLAVDTDLAPVVGQQVTYGPTTANSVGARVDLFKARAAATFNSKILGGATKECELVAKAATPTGLVGYLYAPSAAAFKTSTGQSVTDAQLRSSALTAGREVTYTCVVPGTGARVAFGT
jgi:hypothetical protein